MTLRIINPKFKSQLLIKAETHAPAVLNWMIANQNNKYVTIAELKAGLPAISADLTRAVINQICLIIGAELDGADDAAA